MLNNNLLSLHSLPSLAPPPPPPLPLPALPQALHAQEHDIHHHHCLRVQAELEGCEAVWDSQDQPAGTSRGDAHHQGTAPGCFVAVLHSITPQRHQASHHATLTNQDHAACHILFVPELTLLYHDWPDLPASSDAR